VAVEEGEQGLGTTRGFHPVKDAQQIPSLYNRPGAGCHLEGLLEWRCAVSATITREVMEGYLECEHKGRLRLAGDAGDPSDFQAMNREEEAARARARAHLLALYPGSKQCQGAAVTVPDLRQGVSADGQAPF
jgi:hypothetical protein